MRTCCPGSLAVTGNTRHFPTVWQGIEIVTPRRLLEDLSELTLNQ